MSQNNLKKESPAKSFLELPALDDQRLLSDSLMHQGEMSLLKGDLSIGLDFFEKAIKLQPSDPLFFYRQGLSLLDYTGEEGKEKILLLASRKFKMAIRLNPRHFETWQAWGHTLSALGKHTAQHHYFLDAQEKLFTALKLSENQPSDVLSELYWEYGVVYAQIADNSGEAQDLQRSIQAFQTATTYQEQLPFEFWIGFGKVSLEFAKQINDVRLYVKAISCFKHAITTAISFYEGWVSLAKALQLLYGHTHDEDHFSQANECYVAAAQLQPQNTALWLDWARFLCESGRRNQDPKRLRSCIEKCHRAYACDPCLPQVIAVWAEALAQLGDLSDRLDLIYEAENKISEAFKMDSEDPEIWFSWGICLTAFGRYFNDFDYYYQAIEKFQSGLSIDRTKDHLWHALASTYATLGHIESAPEALELACRFFIRALHLRPQSYTLFDYGLALAKLGEMTHEQKWLEEAVVQLEGALSIQKNAIYLHPDWLFHYACTLDALGDFYEEESYYTRAMEIFSHVIMIDPDFPQAHHRMALAHSHMGELLGESDHFYRAAHHFRLASKHDEEDDQAILDWGITLINIAEIQQNTLEADSYYREAEHKLTQSARLGNVQAYYHLSCLYSLLGQYEKSLRFLEKADNFESLPPIEELLQDDWLSGLRMTSDFREFIAQLEKKPHLQEER